MWIFYCSDTVLLIHENTWSTAFHTAGNSLARITQWFELNLLILNASKTKYNYVFISYISSNLTLTFN